MKINITVVFLFQVLCFASLVDAQQCTLIINALPNASYEEQIKFLDDYFKFNCWTVREQSKLFMQSFMSETVDLEKSPLFQGWHLKSEDKDGEKFVKFQDNFDFTSDTFPLSQSYTIHDGAVVENGTQYSILQNGFNDYSNKVIFDTIPNIQDYYFLRVVNDFSIIESIMSIFAIPKPGSTQDQSTIWSVDVKQKNPQFKQINLNVTLSSPVKRIIQTGYNTLRQFQMMNGEVFDVAYTEKNNIYLQQRNEQDLLSIFDQERYQIRFFKSKIQTFFNQIYNLIFHIEIQYPSQIQNPKRIFQIKQEQFLIQTENGDLYIWYVDFNDFKENTLLKAENIENTQDILDVQTLSKWNDIFILYSKKLVRYAQTNISINQESKTINFVIKTVQIQETEWGKYNKIHLDLQGPYYEHSNGTTIITLNQGIDSQSTLSFVNEIEKRYLAINEEFKTNQVKKPHFDYELLPNKEGQAKPYKFRLHNLAFSPTPEDDDPSNTSSRQITFAQGYLFFILLFLHIILN